MDFLCHISSPLGGLTLASDGEALTGMWFVDQAHFGARLSDVREERPLPVFDEVRRWLALYFDGRQPDFTPPLCPRGTAFQRAVWDALLDIPYGQTTTYGELARRLGGSSARAVGGAVGRNPVSIIVPCHRVRGAEGRLTGYAGGLERKRYLLRLEGVKILK